LPLVAGLAAWEADSAGAPITIGETHAISCAYLQAEDVTTTGLKVLPLPHANVSETGVTAKDSKQRVASAVRRTKRNTTTEAEDTTARIAITGTKKSK